MSRIKKNLSRLSATGMVDRARFHEQRMTDNAAFPTPTPALAAIAAARTALEEAITAAIDGGRTARAIRSARRAELKQLLDQLAGYVASVAEGNELAILSSGFELKRRSAPLPEPLAPAGLRATGSPHPGRVALDWQPARGAVSYHVEVNRASPDDAAAWELMGVSTKARHTATGLSHGRIHWFRVAAIGTAGMGPWSDPAQAMVL
jgi:hypothetical protein